MSVLLTLLLVAISSKYFQKHKAKVHRKMTEQMEYPHGLPPSDYQGHNPVRQKTTNHMTTV
jgi:hypothetical protein